MNPFTMYINVDSPNIQASVPRAEKYTQNLRVRSLRPVLGVKDTLQLKAVVGWKVIYHKRSVGMMTIFLTFNLLTFKLKNIV